MCLYNSLPGLITRFAIERKAMGNLQQGHPKTEPKINGAQQ